MIEELREAGVDLGEVQVRTINLMKGEQFANDFTARNPNQKIPVLRDGDLDIFESCAILQYLAERHLTTLLPLDEGRVGGAALGLLASRQRRSGLRQQIELHALSRPARGH